MTESEELFFLPRWDLLPLYEALRAQLTALFPEMQIRVSRTQISFFSRRMFAMVSLPRSKKSAALIVSFGLGRHCDSARISAASEPYPGRWTHHLPLHDICEIDGELLNLLQEAHAFSLLK